MTQIKGCPTPHDEDDGVSDLEEAVLEFLEDETPMPTIINDQVCELVRFYEQGMESYRGDYHFAKDLASKLVDMSVAINKSISGYGP